MKILLTVLITIALSACAATAPTSAAPDVHLIPWLAANGQYGFVDEAGTSSIPVQYEDAHPFYQGLAAVAKDGHWGFIDTLGHWVVSPKYDRAYDFDANGLGQVLTINSGVNIGGSLLSIYVTGKRMYYKIYNVSGRVVREGQIDHSADIARPYDERPAVADIHTPAIARGETGQWTTGLPGKTDNPSRDTRWGLKDASGHWLVSPRYEQRPMFRGDLARVARACRAFYINTQGREYAADTEHWPQPPVPSCQRTEFYQCAQCKSYYTN